jgi:hypothetical protein
MSETCRVSFQNKFEKLVHLVGFIIKKFVTMHGHVNIKRSVIIVLWATFNRYTFRQVTRMNGSKRP